MEPDAHDRPSGWWFPARTTAYFLIVAAITLGTLAVLGLRQINSINAENSSVRLDRAGRAAAALLVERVDGATITTNANGSPVAITLDADLLQPANSWDELLDAIGGVNQGAANLFRFNAQTDSFDRLSTTFRTPEGDRAGGSQVEPGLITAGHPAFASLSTATPYVGEVPVAGRLRLAYLTPLTAPDGSLSGILAVDVGWVDDLNRINNEAANQAASVTALLLIALAVICVVVMFLSFRPLHRLTEVAHALGTGDNERTVGLTERGDEIGYLAKGLAKVAELQQTLEHRAYNDALTEIPNRAALIRELDLRFASIEFDDVTDTAFALLIIDLDGFKEVNDGLGHQAGDELLAALSHSLQESLYPGEFLARLGGDEFALLSAVGNHTMQSLHPLVERARFHASGVFATNAGNACVTASIGIALVPQHGQTSDEAMRHADLALYEVKRAKPGSALMYETGLSASFDRQMYVVTELRRALAANQLSVAYQPLYDMTGTLRGLEALSRWEHPVEGAIAPSEFIPVAEGAGLIEPLGAWILEDTCRQLAEWAREHERVPIVSVNVSTIQLRHPDFVESVAELLRKYPAARGKLCLELTESVLVSHTSGWHRRVLEQLSGMGVLLAIDDFGTGYSSLSYLNELVVDEVKIDRSFVVAAVGDDSKTQLLDGIVGLGRGLGMVVVLEGIETAEELALARQLDCDLVQGFLMGRPMPASAVADRFDVISPNFAELPVVAA